MKKFILFFTIVLSFAQIDAQEKVMWNKVSQEKVSRLERIKKTSYSENQQFYTLNIDVLRKS
jgi:hypothetical protein